MLFSIFYVLLSRDARIYSNGIAQGQSQVFISNRLLAVSLIDVYSIIGHIHKAMLDNYR